MPRAAVFGTFGSPLLVSGALVERNHRCLFTAGGANEVVAIDGHRFAVAPFVILLAFEILLHVLSPQFLAGGRIAANQFAARRNHVNSVAIDRRRAARALPRFLLK